jgi:hypothetical protein
LFCRVFFTRTGRRRTKPAMAGEGRYPLRSKTLEGVRLRSPLAEVPCVKRA